MSVSLPLVLTAGVLIACGLYLMLERTLTRIILGFVLLGNGVNLLYIIAAGPRGTPPFEGTADPAEMSDPLPFAMVLTAIVITLGVTAFVMALAYRAWQLFGHDEVPDDVEDRRVLRRSRRRSGGESVAAVRWADALDEDVRRGALMVGQGLSDGDDTESFGADLTSAEDVFQDATEADEAQDDPDDDSPADGFEDPSEAWQGSHPGDPVGEAPGPSRSDPVRDADPEDPGTSAAHARASTRHGRIPGTGPATDAGDHLDEHAEREER